MLGLFRRKAQSRPLQITILIIILVFIFWGVGRNNNSKVSNAVATVNGEPITFRDYQKQYEQTVNSIRDQFGGSIPSGLLDQLNIKQQVVDKLIQSTLLRQGAMKMGLYVSDQELQSAIKVMEAFKTNGIFDVKRYEEVLAASRMTVSQFEEGMRYDLLAQKVIAHLGRFGHVSPVALKDIFNYQYHQIKLDYVAVKADSFLDKVDKGESKVKAFYDEHKGDYMSDPQAKIKYLLFAVADFTKESSPSDEEIEKYYQANSARFTTPERIQARHILIKSAPSDPPAAREAARKKIDEIAAKLKGGEDFAKLAKKYSEDSTAAQGGDLGLFGRGMMVKPFEDAAFALKEGQVSDVVETSFGFHLIKVDKVEPEKHLTLDEAKSSISEQLAKETAKSKAFQAANDAYEQIIVAGSLAKYAEGKGAGANAIATSDLFAQKDPPKDLQGLPAVVNAAFTLNKGELSSIIETEKGYAIVMVDDKQPPAQLEFQAVRDKVEADYAAAESKKLAEKSAEEILTKVKEGAKLAEEAKGKGLEMATTPFISRVSHTDANTLPAPIVQDCLNLSPNNPVLGKVAEDNGSYYVVAFSSEKDPDQSLFEGKKGELEAKLADERKNDLLVAWIESLRQNAKIATNMEML